MRARRTRTSNRMHRGENPAIIQRLEWSKRWMQAEETVEVDRCFGGKRPSRSGRPRNCNGRPQRVVRFLAVRNDHVECVRGTALKEANQCFALRSLQ